MKALSIRQPWAFAILYLGKRVENRDWAGCSYRGPVLLHASKSRHLGEFDDAIMDIRSILAKVHGKSAGLTPQPPADLAVWTTARNIPRWVPAPTLPLGGVVGRARIVDAIEEPHAKLFRSGEAHMCPAWTSPSSGACPCASPWWAGGFALVLADVEPLPFIPFKGSLGFFDVPDEIVHEAVRQRDEPGQCPCETKLNNPEPHATGCRNADPLLRAWTMAREREREAAAEERYIAECEKHRAAPC